MATVALCDTHCHIHDQDYPVRADELLASAIQNGVSRIITMGSNLSDSRLAVDYANRYDGQSSVTVRAGVGVYPQETGDISMATIDGLQQLIKTKRDRIGAIGEIGLDYCYDTVPRRQQIRALEMLIQLAVDNHLPASFHVRSGQFGDAFADFWPLLANFSGVTGALHSFTDNLGNMTKVLDAGLYLGVNGIVTFNRDEQLTEVYRAMPLERIVLETDAPYLTPKPFRGQTNQPCHINQIAEHLAQFKSTSLEALAKQTTANAIAVYPGLA